MFKVLVISKKLLPCQRRCIQMVQEDPRLQVLACAMLAQALQPFVSNQTNLAVSFCSQQAFSLAMFLENKVSPELRLMLG